MPRTRFWSSKPIDISGKRFGSWTVIRRVKYSNWECRCDCGTVRILQGSSLKRGTSQRCIACMGKYLTTHGMDGTSTYLIWAKMKHRCHAHPNYAGRGIRVCDRWLKFENFLADMGERPKGKSIDRINNNGDYEPANCRWATPTQQIRNRRNTTIILWKGERRVLGDLADEYQIPVKLVRDRLAVGWSIEKALTMKSQKSSALNQGRIT